MEFVIYLSALTVFIFYLSIGTEREGAQEILGTFIKKARGYRS